MRDSLSLFLKTTPINNASEVIFAAIQNQNFKTVSPKMNENYPNTERILKLTSSHRISYALLALFAVEIFVSLKLHSVNCTQIISEWRREDGCNRKRDKDLV